MLNTLCYVIFVTTHEHNTWKENVMYHFYAPRYINVPAHCTSLSLLQALAVN